MICLDTNVVIVLINRRSPTVRHRFEAQLALGTPIVLPAICLFEMHYGHAKSDRRAKSDRQLDLFLAQGVTIAPFDAEDAAHAGEIRAELEAKGTPIGFYDYLIAAQARRRRATLVTSNFGEFARVPGLLVVDWAA
jgi:tRNA(fMet)-specific endonuclease VapC